MILGLDISLNETGWYFIAADGNERSGIIKVPERLKAADQNLARLAWLQGQFGSLLADLRADGLRVVAIEDYSYGSNSSSTYAIGEWGGIVRLHLFNLGLRILCFSPNSVKKFAVPDESPKDTKKEHVILNVYKRWGRNITNNNMADAFILAAMGVACQRPTEPRPVNWQANNLTKAQLKALTGGFRLAEGVPPVSDFPKRKQ